MYKILVSLPADDEKSADIICGLINDVHPPKVDVVATKDLGSLVAIMSFNGSSGCQKAKQIEAQLVGAGHTHFGMCLVRDPQKFRYVPDLKLGDIDIDVSQFDETI